MSEPQRVAKRRRSESDDEAEANQRPRSAPGPSQDIPIQIAPEPGSPPDYEAETPDDETGIAHLAGGQRRGRFPRPPRPDVPMELIRLTYPTIDEAPGAFLRFALTRMPLMMEADLYLAVYSTHGLYNQPLIVLTSHALFAINCLNFPHFFDGLRQSYQTADGPSYRIVTLTLPDPSSLYILMEYFFTQDGRTLFDSLVTGSRQFGDYFIPSFWSNAMTLGAVDSGLYDVIDEAWERSLFPDLDPEGGQYEGN